MKIKLRSLALLFCLAFRTVYVIAQDVEYKKGAIYVDGNEYAKVEVEKQNFGLTKNFQLFSLTGEKLVIAVVATEFQQDKSDNSYLFYRFTFLKSGQIGIFKIAALGQEKSFAKLIGSSGIIVKNTTDDKKVMEFIASRGATPSIAIDYTTVARNKAWPIELKEDKTIQQDAKQIGSFKHMGTGNGLDSYEYKLPSGILVARLSFAGGNNAQNFEVFTPKDNLKRVVNIPQKETIKFSASVVDANYFTLKRVTKWLVDNNYL